MPAGRQPLVALTVSVAGLVAAAPAHARLTVRVAGWTVTRVNQETRRLPADGAAPLCQAIPAVALAPRLRWTGARPAGAGATGRAAHRGVRVRLRLAVPGHRARTRVVVLRGRAGRLAPVFTARDLGLRADAFEAGAYRLAVRRGGRTLARGRLRLVAGGTC